MRLVWLAVLVGAVFIFFSASCGPSVRCSSSTCASGCCDPNGLCQSGRSSTACGKNGNSCMACLLGQSCDLGTCSGGFNNGAGNAGGGFVNSGGSAGGGFVTSGGSSGGGSTVCNTQTCSGCCDFSGQCQSGTTTTACGGAATTGGACVQCAGSQICQNRACVTGAGGGAPSCPNGCIFSGQCLQAGTPMQSDSLCGNAGANCRACSSPTPQCSAGFCVPAGSGGGTIGGGPPGGGIAGGGSAGGVAGCAPLSLPTSFPGGAFAAYDTGYELLNPGIYNFAYFNSTDTMVGFEFVRASAGVSLPYTGAITTDNYAACQNCILYGEGCTSFTPMLTCTRRYLGQAGTAAVSSATESTTSGSFIGTVTGVTFREWNFMTDSAVAGGRCYTLAAASYSVSW